MDKKEYKKWYKSCEFINENMKFYSFKDFLTTPNIYKFTYNRSSELTKMLYKWYIYANNHLSFERKNAIWDYLNGYMSLEELKKS